MKKIRTIEIKRKKKKHWEYDVLLRGLNFRLTDFQSALGLSQLKKINKFIKKRKKISLKYYREIRNIKKISLTKLTNNYKSSYHLCIIHLQKQNQNLKEKMIKFMLKNSVMLQYHYIPIYKFKIFQDKYINKNAEIYYNSAISLPIYYSLSEKSQNLIIRLLKKFFKKD